MFRGAPQGGSGLPLSGTMRLAAMNRRFVQALVLLPVLALFAPAQEPDVQEELRFVQALRSEHYYDQALKYIGRMEKGAAADLAKELALERTLISFDKVADNND